MADPLGQVALGHEGSGLAQVLGTGNFNPGIFAAIPQQMYEKQQAEKKLRYAAGVKDLADLKPEGLNEDIVKEVIPAINAFKKKFTDYHRKGIDPNDPRNVDAYIDFQKAKTETEGLIQAAKEKKANYTSAYETYTKNPGDEKFDPTDTQNSLNQYYSTSLKDVESLKKQQSEGILKAGYNFNVHNQDEIFKGVKLNKTVTSEPKLDPTGKFYVASAKESPDEKDLAVRVDQVVNNPTSQKEVKWNKQVDNIIDRAVQSPVLDANGNVVSYSTGVAAYDKAINETLSDANFSKLSAIDQRKKLKMAIGIEIGKSLYPEKVDENYHFIPKNTTNVNIGENNGQLIPTYINNSLQKVEDEIKTSPGAMTLKQQFEALSEATPSTIMYDPAHPDTPVGLKLNNPANLGDKYIEASKGQILTFRDGKFRPLTGAKGTVAGQLQDTIIIWKDKNGVTTIPGDPNGRKYFQLIMKPISTSGGDAQKKLDELDRINISSNATFVNESASQINKEAQKKTLANTNDVKGLFKIEYPADDPAAQSIVAQLGYGSSVVANTMFNKARKSNQPAAPAGKTKQGRTEVQWVK